eukprot:6188150-Pleurochrysis_carterae.AAC.3
MRNFPHVCADADTHMCICAYMHVFAHILRRRFLNWFPCIEARLRRACADRSTDTGKQTDKKRARCKLSQRRMRRQIEAHMDMHGLNDQTRLDSGTG